jgi:hypothetical protein
MKHVSETLRSMNFLHSVDSEPESLDICKECNSIESLVDGVCQYCNHCSFCESTGRVVTRVAYGCMDYDHAICDCEGFEEHIEKGDWRD